VRPNGLSGGARAQNAEVKIAHGETTVLVAVDSARVREALVAMLGALDGFRVVAEAANDVAAVEAARTHRPHLALVDTELSGWAGWWAIQCMQAERLVPVVVALGRRANGLLARHVGARIYVQMGTSPRDLLSALQAAVANGVSSAQAEDDLLADAHTVLDEPALVDF
jgi:DNA-binding NarL/FixJ family response regulator